MWYFEVLYLMQLGYVDAATIGNSDAYNMPRIFAGENLT